MSNSRYYKFLLKKQSAISIKKKIILFLTFAFVLWFYFLLPDNLFNAPYSTVILDKNDELLGAKIAKDGQWRFPVSDTVPYKFKQSLIQFEDAWFYKHPGVNPVSLIKALYTDIKAGKIVRGGSTLTMQLARIARHHKKRNLYQKLMEILWALRLEMRYSKDKILNLYVSHAPFGGNVVGLEAAAWRYYGRSPDKLSWGEAATLAVLPNAPALIYPGKNHKILLNKRNRLLDKLWKKNIIDSITCVLAQEEPLPGKPKQLPRKAPHLLEKIIKDGHGGQRLQTSIDGQLQERIKQVARRHHTYLSGNHINNLAVLVLDTKTGEILSYIGNIYDKKVPNYQVDMIQANRSSGSTLKPFLYAWALKDAEILPNMLLPDIPTQISGYHPENFDKTYSGAVPAGIALAKSLNIPAVKLLQKYGLTRFYEQLQKTPVQTVNKTPDYYGLTIILGGAEVKLWELTATYASMGRVLHYYNNGGKYSPKLYHQPIYVSQKTKISLNETDDLFGADNIWFVFDALSKKDRPVEGDDWNIYRSAQRIAWKTGTSFGHKDAWCIGVNPQYTVGIWVGNATGEGRPGLTGTRVAAPLMFDIFKLLPSAKWFEKPLEKIHQAKICKKSGYLANPDCTDTSIEEIPENGIRSKTCPYCKVIHLNREENFQVNSSCYPVDQIKNVSRFVLPPVMAYYYKQFHHEYKNLPPWDINCRNENQQNIALIYPKNNSKIFLPKDFNQVQQKLVLQAAHSNAQATIFWHLDNQYIGQTQGRHKLEKYIRPGKHRLTLIDEKGETLSIDFVVVR